MAHASRPHRNSTNVRSLILRGLGRAAFAVLNRVRPALGARLAETLFFTPPRGRRRTAPSPGARAFGVTVGGRRVAGWSLGRGPAVLLAHGWGGTGAQLAAFAGPLAAHGFTAVGFDAPGHGASEGRWSSMPEFAAALRAVAAEVGDVRGVIGHSLGAAAATLAMRDGLPAPRAVFVGPPRTPAEWTARMAEALGIAPAVMDAFRTRTEGRLAIRWEDLDVPTLARSMAADLLVLHDRGDREVPWTDGLAVATAWPGARLVTTAGLGHHRILRDPEVVARAVAFLAGEEAPAPAPGWPEPCATAGCLRPAARCGPHCLACGFERELYAPATRARMQTMPAV